MNLILTTVMERRKDGKLVLRSNKVGRVTAEMYVTRVNCGRIEPYFGLARGRTDLLLSDREITRLFYDIV
jgi:hypothetical protein